MNHGTIGFIDGQGKLSVDQDILNTLCLSVGSKLYGIYYPCRPGEQNEEYKDATVKHDFMLTPIPTRFWKISARIHIHLKHKPGSLNLIGEYLKERHVSIIHSELTRSAYRYVTWSMHIVFENLLGADLRFDDSRSYYEETYKAYNALVSDMNVNMKLREALYQFSPAYSKFVEGSINCPLSYFANFWETKLNLDWLTEEDKKLIEPFELSVENHTGYLLLGGDKQFRFVIKALQKKDKHILPAITFSELHTKSLNIRTVILSAFEGKRFFKVKITYERVGGIDECKGLIHSITSKMPSKYNIWQAYNYTVESSFKSEIGVIVFLIENISNITPGTDFIPIDSYLAEAHSHFNQIASETGTNNFTFNIEKITPLPLPYTLAKESKTTFDQRTQEPFTFDIFISYSRSDFNYAHELKRKFEKAGLRVHLDSVEMKYGLRIDTSLLTNIFGSMEMCVIISKIAAESEWVRMEWGAAWVLDKIITPIVLDPTTIPDRLKGILYVNGNSPKEIKDFADQVLKRKLEQQSGSNGFWK